jgi:acetylornithine deacetylase/succinyl-diaminopimelate desuccinylase family protein
MASFGIGKDTLYFHGHYDVVPALEKQFNPRVVGKRLYGRGASDMKGGLTSMIYALRVLQLLNFKPRGRVCLVIVPDEETGGELGTNYLFKHGYIARDSGIGMLMPEPTSGAVWHACRGALSILVTIKGKSTHVVLQNEGINAFDQMVELSNALHRLKLNVEKRKTKCKVAKGESRNSILMLGGVCQCGTNFNIVPGECTFSIERRINPEEDFVTEKRRLLKIIDRFRKKGMNITTTVLQAGESAGTSSDHDVANALVDSIHDITNKKPRFYMCPGLLEIRYYLKNGIPALAYGPGMLSKAHGPNESIDIERIYDCAIVYALTAVRMLSS